MTPEPTLEEMARQLSDRDLFDKIKDMYGNIAVAEKVLSVLLPELVRRTPYDETEEDETL